MNQIVRLQNIAAFWSAENFQDVFKQEIEQLEPSLLPLQQGLSQGSYVADEPFKVMVIGVAEEKDSVLVKAGIFYQSVIAGCSCADDPTPIDTNQEYCVVQFAIDKNSGEASVALIEEES